jgi:antirestriction protein
MGQAAEDLEPRIYVACLAAYNSGWLHGAWIDVGDDADAVWAAIAAMLKTSPVARAEEWAIHDYEGFGGVEIAEYAGVDRVVEVAGSCASAARLGPWCWSMSAVRSRRRSASSMSNITASSKAWPTASKP